MLDGHNGFGVGRGRRGRRFGHGRGGRVNLLLLLVVQMVLMSGRRLEHYGGTATAERARMVRRGRRVLVERSVQLFVSRVSGRERRHGHGRRPPVSRCSGGRRRRLMPLVVRRPLLRRRWRTVGRRVARGRGRGRGVGRVLAGHVGQRPYARFRSAALRRQATASATTAGDRRRHGREPVVRRGRRRRMVVVV